MITSYTIHHLDCHSCAILIEGICEDIAGVDKAEVKATKKILKVSHNLSDTTIIEKTLSAEGYPVELIS